MEKSAWFRKRLPLMLELLKSFPYEHMADVKNMNHKTARRLNNVGFLSKSLEIGVF